MNKKNKVESIVIGSNHLVKNIEPLIAKKLKDKLNYKIIFVAKTKEDQLFYKNNFKECFDDVYNNKFKVDSTYINYHKKYKNPEKKALEIEKKYNISIYRLFFTHRVLGRGFFASGGVRHPRNKTHWLSTNRDLLNMAINFITFWEDLFKRENVKISLNLDNISNQLAIKNNIKSLRLYEGKFKNTYSWTEKTSIEPEIKLKDLKLKKKYNLKKVIIGNPYDSYAIARAVDVHNLKLINTLKIIFFTILQISYGKLRGYEKAHNKYILDEVFFIWNIRKSYLEYSKKTNINLKKLKYKKFIFLPLLTEPEIALSGIADDFFFQLSVINLISRDLPSDYTLVVKEHILAFGRRPKDFYKQISDLRNVVFADPDELGLDYIKNCKAVACITGTSAWEAIVMGIPVISFSRNNTWNFLNHVYFLSSFENLRYIFLSIDKENYPNKKSISEGASFYKAYFEKLIPVKSYNNLIPLSNNIKKIPSNMKDVAQILFSELEKKLKKN